MYLWILPIIRTQSPPFQAPLGPSRSKRTFLMIGHAGDRSDTEIRELTNGALMFQPDVVVTYELEEYLRGREIGDVPGVIRRACLDKGMQDDAVLDASCPSKGAQMIVDQLQEGDLALLLALDERDKIIEILTEGA